MGNGILAYRTYSIVTAPHVLPKGTRTYPKKWCICMIMLIDLKINK